VVLEEPATARELKWGSVTGGLLLPDSSYLGDVPGQPRHPIQHVAFLKAKAKGSKIKFMEETHLKEKV
jgi:hypothetical protein